jgi:hypothetical protein
LSGKGKEETHEKDNPDDIPMVYLLYVLLAIGGIVAGRYFWSSKYSS